jgi:mannan endo-1,4-beta-mannosidase
MRVPSPFNNLHAKIVRRIRRAGIALLAGLLTGCALTSAKSPAADAYVSVQGDTFYLHGEPYYFVGTNLWYGAYLGSPGKTGNRDRLREELDILKRNGITNLRVLAASESSELVMSLRPAFQPEPGKYNEELLQGLDYLLMEMGKRDMKAVIFLNNYWQWSSGMSQYVTWVTGQPIIDPDVFGDWNGFMQMSASFYRLEEAQALYRNYLSAVVNRRNSYTGVYYRDDPVIMSWELANEPRPGSNKEGRKYFQFFKDWIAGTAGYIQSLDSNHLVTTGSEGSWGTLNDNELFMDSHATPHIDYLTFHLWLKNWNWFDAKRPQATYEEALSKGYAYIDEHIEMARKLNKPVVLEEFGVERDNADYRIESGTVYRDRIYSRFFDLVYRRAAEGAPIAGSNFWGWGGLGRARNADFIWREDDEFTGDPPQEPQGLNSVFDVDVSTLRILKEHAAAMQGLADLKSKNKNHGGHRAHGVGK